MFVIEGGKLVEIKPLIRLACQDCDRTDFDFIYELPKNWVCVEEANEHEKSPGEYYLWFTHIGTCPECQE